MKCLKIGHHRYNFFLLFSVVGILFCSFLFSSSSYAVSDLSITLTPANYSDFANSPLFSSCNDSSCLSDYHYLTVSGSGSNFNQYSYWQIGGLRGVNDMRVYVNSSVLIDGSSSLSFGSIFLFGDVSYTFTLSDSLPCSCPTCPDEPSGELAITSNGQYDVTNFASVDVNVPAEVVQGDYHDDLQDLKHSIIICGAILLVIYFFYCIYRMFFRTLGGV